MHKLADNYFEERFAFRTVAWMTMSTPLSAGQSPPPSTQPTSKIQPNSNSQLTDVNNLTKPLVNEEASVNVATVVVAVTANNDTTVAKTDSDKIILAAPDVAPLQQTSADETPTDMTSKKLKTANEIQDTATKPSAPNIVEPTLTPSVQNEILPAQKAITIANKELLQQNNSQILLPTATTTIITSTSEGNISATLPPTAKNQTQLAAPSLKTTAHIVNQTPVNPTTVMTSINQNTIRPSVLPSISNTTILNAQNRLSTAIPSTVPTIFTTTVAPTSSKTSSTTQAAAPIIAPVIATLPSCVLPISTTTIAPQPISLTLDMSTTQTSQHHVPDKIPSDPPPQPPLEEVEMAIEPPSTSNSQSETKITATPNELMAVRLNVKPNKSNMQAKTMSDEQVTYICCLLDNGIRCERVAGNASFSRRIQKIVGTKKMNFSLDPNVRHAYICEHHKGLICVAKNRSNVSNRDTQSKNNSSNMALAIPQTNSNNFNSNIMSRPIPPPHLQHPNIDPMNQNRLVNNHANALNNLPMRQTSVPYPTYNPAVPTQMGSIDMMMGSFDSGDTATTSNSSSSMVDLHQLQVNTLRRYKRHFRVQTRPGLNKMQLAESLQQHFRTMPIIEKEAITYFVYIVKCCRNKLDQNPKIG